MMLRRRDGIRPMSLLTERWPDRSVSVSTASFNAASTKPCSSEAQATCTTDGSGASGRSVSSRAAMPSLPSTSTMRAAGPCPSVTNTARQPSASHPLVSASARALSPRYVSGARMPNVRVSASSSSSTANWLTDHHGMPMSWACSRTSASDHRQAAPRSTGAWPPPAVAAQDASRNSRLVATRSAARVRIRSGSQATTMPPDGMTSISSSMSSTSTGASDSMPSTAMPSAIRLSSSASSGCSSASRAARSRTCGVSSSSRHGGAHSPCSATSRLRWSATLK